MSGHRQCFSHHDWVKWTYNCTRDTHMWMTYIFPQILGSLPLKSHILLMFTFLN